MYYTVNPVLQNKGKETHLMKLELEAKDVAQGLVLTHVGLNQRYEELILV